MWGLEEALDIEYAHAMAPMAHIVVVETNFNYNDLMNRLTTSSPVPARAPHWRRWSR